MMILCRGGLGEGAVLLLYGQLDVLPLPYHLYIAAQRKRGEKVLRFPHLLAEDLGAEAQGELLHADPEGLGEDEVSQLMNEDERPEGDDCKQYAHIFPLL